MNNLQAQVKIEDTGEIIRIEGDSVAEMLYKIRQAVGDYVNVTIHTLAVMAFVLCVLSHASYANTVICADQNGYAVCYQSGSIEDITTAGDMRAPTCSGAHCIKEVPR